MNNALDQTKINYIKNSIGNKLFKNLLLDTSKRLDHVYELIQIFNSKHFSTRTYDIVFNKQYNDLDNLSISDILSLPIDISDPVMQLIKNKANRLFNNGNAKKD